MFYKKFERFMTMNLFFFQTNWASYRKVREIPQGTHTSSSSHLKVYSFSKFGHIMWAFFWHITKTRLGTKNRIWFIKIVCYELKIDVEISIVKITSQVFIYIVFESRTAHSDNSNWSCKVLIIERESRIQVLDVALFCLYFRLNVQFGALVS